MKQKIGVIGGGVVGSATARTYLGWADVRVFDLQPERSTVTLAEALDSDLVFVCLPTPQSRGGLAPDLSAVESFFASVAGSETVFALRSTVPIGTTRSLRGRHRLSNLIHYPEFLTARCSFTDAQLPARHIVGSMNCHGKRVLCDLLKRRFRGTAIHSVASDESELIKLATNAFFAVKIAFFNELRQLCDVTLSDWEAVLGGVLSDGRIAHSHTLVPGPDGLRGFGGTCLPKDLDCFVYELVCRGQTPEVSAAASRRNKGDRACAP